MALSQLTVMSKKGGKEWKFRTPGVLFSAIVEKKDGKKEESPLLVAQRFVNVYRQVHVFGQEVLLRYNDMLLKSSEEVRIMLEDLPGGVEVLEYIKFLEEQNLPMEEEDGDALLSDEEKAKAKLMGAAMAEVQEKSQEKTHEQAVELAREQTEALIVAQKQTQEASLQQVGYLTKELANAQREVQSEEQIKSIAMALQGAKNEYYQTQQVEQKPTAGLALPVEHSLPTMISGEAPVVQATAAHSVQSFDGVITALIKAQEKSAETQANVLSKALSSSIAEAISRSQEQSSKAIADAFSASQEKTARIQSELQAQALANALSETQKQIADSQASAAQEQAEALADAMAKTQASSTESLAEALVATQDQSSQAQAKALALALAQTQDITAQTQAEVLSQAMSDALTQSQEQTAETQAEVFAKILDKKQEPSAKTHTEVHVETLTQETTEPQKERTDVVEEIKDSSIEHEFEELEDETLEHEFEELEDETLEHEFEELEDDDVELISFEKDPYSIDGKEKSYDAEIYEENPYLSSRDEINVTVPQNIFLTSDIIVSKEKDSKPETDIFAAPSFESKYRKENPYLSSGEIYDDFFSIVFDDEPYQVEGKSRDSEKKLLISVQQIENNPYLSQRKFFTKTKESSAYILDKKEKTFGKNADTATKKQKKPIPFTQHLEQKDPYMLGMLEDYEETKEKSNEYEELTEVPKESNETFEEYEELTEVFEEQETETLIEYKKTASEKEKALDKDDINAILRTRPRIKRKTSKAKKIVKKKKTWFSSLVDLFK